MPCLPFYNDHLKYYVSEHEILEPSPDVRDLGIIFTPNLSWSDHVAAITSAAKKKAGWVLSSFCDRSPTILITLYKSHIRSLLEYNCPLWNGLNLSETRSLEAVQRSFTNKIVCPASTENYWDRLKYLHLMSLQRRRERYAIVFMWKIRFGKVSNDLEIDFVENTRFGSRAIIPPLVSATRKAQSLFDARVILVNNS